MRQDRKVNGWILISSILQIIFGLIFIAIGALCSVLGFLKPEKLTNLKDISFFINQKGLIDFQLKICDNQVLKDEKYLYLFLGIIVAVIGLIALIFACVEFSYAKKRKIVRHRVAVLIFTLIPLSITICASIYLVLEFKVLTDNIKYVLYGVGGIFALITICNILGLIVNRSEQFMSNDNNKYAFGNSSLRNARVEVNNNVKDAEVQPQQRLIANQVDNTQGAHPQVAQQPQQRVLQPRPQQGMISTRPQQGVRPSTQNTQRPVQGVQNRPQGTTQARPMQPRPQVQAVRPSAQPVRPTQGQVARPVGQSRPIQAHPASASRPQINSGVQGTARPVNSGMVARPVENRSQVTSSQTLSKPSTQAQNKYCVKCGKLLSANETFCSICGNKV